jgi:predicted nucleic acid-binding protein
MASIVIQDACVLINLLASGRFDDIANGCGFRFAIASIVAQEALFLRNANSGKPEQIDLQPIIERDILEVLTVESEVEKLRYIDMTLDLDDGEAESIAIAETRSFALATDDKKARNIIQRRGLKIELWSTCGLLRYWQSKCSISDNDLGRVLINISSRAKYHPKFGHLDFEWWTKLLKQPDM